jgi:hypothetical protein
MMGAVTTPPDPLDDAHRRPPGVDDGTVEAVGVVSEALECLERASGRLYDFDQMVGHLDTKMGEAAELLEREVVGRNVLDGRWTFQVIAEFDDLYYEPLRAAERHVRDQLMDGAAMPTRPR